MYIKQNILECLLTYHGCALNYALIIDPGSVILANSFPSFIETDSRGISLKYRILCSSRKHTRTGVQRLSFRVEETLSHLFGSELSLLRFLFSVTMDPTRISNKEKHTLTFLFFSLTASSGWRRSAKLTLLKRRKMILRDADKTLSLRQRCKRWIDSHETLGPRLKLHWRESSCRNPCWSCRSHHSWRNTHATHAGARYCHGSRFFLHIYHWNKKERHWIRSLFLKMYIFKFSMSIYKISSVN